MRHYYVIVFAVPLLLDVGATAHTVLTEPDDQKVSRCGMASIKSTVSYLLKLFLSLKVL